MGTVRTRCYGDDLAGTILRQAREEFEALTAEIPYIGEDENHLTGSLIGSSQCLAFYQTMTAHGKSAAEAGKILYDAVKAHPDDYIPKIPPDQWLSRDRLMRRRRERTHAPGKVDPAQFDYAAEDGALAAWKEIQG